MSDDHSLRNHYSSSEHLRAMYLRRANDENRLLLLEMLERNMPPLYNPLDSRTEVEKNRAKLRLVKPGS